VKRMQKLRLGKKTRDWQKKIGMLGRVRLNWEDKSQTTKKAKR